MNNLTTLERPAELALGDFSPEMITHSLLTADYTSVEDFERSEEFIEKERYRNYLVKSLQVLKWQATERGHESLDVEAEEIFDELQFWKVENFVPPFIMENHKGGLVFLWQVDGRLLRLERRKEGIYSIRVRLTPFSPTKNKTRVVTEEEILQRVAQVYTFFVNKMLEVKEDWRSRFYEPAVSSRI